mmetsp:Transcript_15244/g.65275  ORF Transcript_15244/g.65275 Transcript_15244/m.65275 type:complete len:238 (-) Transcript_15244:2248-2961(-)
MSRESFSIAAKVLTSAPNVSNPSARSATSIAAANSFGPASIGPSRWLGMIRSKSHCATVSAHALTSSLLRGNANTCRIGGTNSGLAHRLANPSRQEGSQVKPSRNDLLTLARSIFTSTAAGWNSSPKSTVLPQPIERASRVLGNIASGRSMPRTNSGSGSMALTGGGSGLTCSTTSVTSIVLLFLWKNAVSTNQGSLNPRRLEPPTCSTLCSISPCHGTAPTPDAVSSGSVLGEPRG